MRLILFIAAICFRSISAFGAENVSSFNALKAEDLRGNTVSFETYAGKVALVVNTASKCGYTPQYGSLQKLFDTYKDKGFVVLGFPSDDFKQENLNGQEIEKFCKLNYGVTFPLFKKSHVNGAERHPVFAFLTDKAEKKGDVQWNFEKFLVNRKGQVVGRFSSSVTPTDPEFTKVLEAAISEPKS